MKDQDPWNMHGGDEHDSKSNSSNDDDDDDDFDFITSEWENSVETGLIINWPGSSRPLHLSTKLEEEMIAPLFDGTQWAGTRVWKAAVFGLEYILANKNNNKNNNLLELGCGLGVPAMLWSLLHEQEEDNPKPNVVLTDQPDLLPQLQANIERNFHPKKSETDHVEGDNSADKKVPDDVTIRAEALSWSKEGILKLLGKNNNNNSESDGDEDTSSRSSFGICLNCDCIYEPLYGRDSWQALADVLAVIAEVSPSTMLVTSVERRNSDGLEEFLERLTASSKVEPIQRVLRNEDDPHHVIEIYVTKGKEPSSS